MSPIPDIEFNKTAKKLDETNTLLTQLISVEQQNNQLLKNISKKEYTINAPNLSTVELSSSGEPLLSESNQFYEIRKFYYDRETKRWYKRKRITHIGSSTSVTANTYVGGATEPTFVDQRPYIGLDTTFLITEMWLTALHAVGSACAAGMYAYSGDKTNPFMGIYNTTAYAAYGNMAPMIAPAGLLLYIKMDPPVFIGPHVEFQGGFMNLGADDRNIMYMFTIDELEVLTDAQIEQYHLHVLYK